MVDTLLQLTDSKKYDLYGKPLGVHRKIRETPFVQKILPSTINFETTKYIFVIKTWSAYALDKNVQEKNGIKTCNLRTAYLFNPNKLDYYLKPLGQIIYE